jgi:hypothetical protein
MENTHVRVGTWEKHGFLSPHVSKSLGVQGWKLNKWRHWAGYCTILYCTILLRNTLLIYTSYTIIIYHILTINYAATMVAYHHPYHSFEHWRPCGSHFPSSEWKTSEKKNLLPVNISSLLSLIHECTFTSFTIIHNHSQKAKDKWTETFWIVLKNYTEFVPW